MTQIGPVFSLKHPTDRHFHPMVHQIHGMDFFKYPINSAECSLERARASLKDGRNRTSALTLCQMAHRTRDLQHTPRTSPHRETLNMKKMTSLPLCRGPQPGNQRDDAARQTPAGRLQHHLLNPTPPRHAPRCTIRMSTLISTTDTTPQPTPTAAPSSA